MNSPRIKNNIGMTLVELVVSIIVLGVVVLAAGSVYVSAVKEFLRITNEARIQTETVLLLDHIYKNLMGAKDIEEIGAGGNSIVALTDDPDTKPKIKYELDAVNKTVIFYKNYDPPGSSGASETIAYFIEDLTFTQPLAPSMLNYVTADVTAKKDTRVKKFTTGIVLRGMRPIQQ